MKLYENPCSERAEFFHADGRTDGQTDVTKLTVAFRNFANAPKIYMCSICNISVRGDKRSYF